LIFQNKATATAGPVAIGPVQSSWGHIFGPIDWTLVHYAWAPLAALGIILLIS
jgi:hypothetical protein